MSNAVVNGTGTGTGASGSEPAGSGAAGDGTAGNGAATGERTVTDLVTLLTDRALALSVQAPRAPTSVRISAGAVEVEICWPTSAGPAAPAPALAVAPAAAAPLPAAPSPGNEPAGDRQPGMFPLCAETVGTFYRAPEPGAAPFVTKGDRLRPGQQIGIIEAMKLMIPVEADRSGEVVEFLVTDQAPVEYGQPLLMLREAAP
jgi:acetyl-CoA carboxylase biotin carboxyl carrier protein